MCELHIELWGQANSILSSYDMKCVYCSEKAGIFKRVCAPCIKLVEAFNSLPPSFGYRQLLDTFIATGASDERIEMFLGADVDGRGSMNDHVTARMTNEVMAGLGQPSHMTAEDVKKVREDITSGKPPSKTDKEILSH